ncbi:MAG: flagellar biosynthetic protein FliR [Angelakisella sp.]
MTIQFDGLMTFLLVFVRMAAMLIFNPLLTRRNVPSRVTMALALCLTFMLAPNIVPAPEFTPFDTAFAIFRELFVGFVCGFVFQIFYLLLFFVGDFIDMQFGLSMAKVFDPGTNIQASISGKLLNIMFALYFFATGSHLVMLKLFSSSYMILPAGAANMTLSSAKFIIEVFIAAFSLVIRLALPFVIAEFTVEIAMGVLMKLIPQIHVFVINMQIKVGLGLLLLILFAQPVSSFIDNYTILMLENMQRAIYALAA